MTSERNHKQRTSLLKLLEIFAIVFILTIVSANILFGVDIVGSTSPNEGSMYPNLFEGEYVLIIPADPGEIQAGDIISVINGDSGITHRVQKVIIENGAYFYVTKGDNPSTNPDIDQHSQFGTLIHHDQVLGKVISKINPIFGGIYYGISTSDDLRNFLILTLLFVIAGIYLLGNRLDQALQESFGDMKIDLSISRIKKFITTISYRRLLLTFIFLLLLPYTSNIMVFIISPESRSFETRITSVNIDNPTELSERVLVDGTSQIIAYTKFIVDVSFEIGNNILGYPVDLTLLVTSNESDSSLSEIIWAPLSRSMYGEFSISFAAILLHDVLNNMTHSLIELNFTTTLHVRDNLIGLSNYPNIQTVIYDNR